MTKANVTVKVNGQGREAEVEPRLLLVHFLRENLGLTGAHVGCETTNCGACTVLLDGVPVKSCTVLAVQADGRDVTTVEGLAKDGVLDPVQQAFISKHGMQCGFCTPGMLVSAYALLEEDPDPTEEGVRAAISGNICRCTGYGKIVDSVKEAARLRRGRRRPPRARPR
ncbi:MAG: (2Fe-2S)-binding protein [Nitrososphaerota archaeon]|nr:(2Fe-2S)-binding protein [Nitrososphaerota archaeon]